MADPMTNGVLNESVDIEMKEEPPVETSMNGITPAPQNNDSSNPAAQPTNVVLPEPSQPTTSAEPQIPLPEHLSTIQPQQSSLAAPAPPVTSTRPTSIPPPPSVRPEKPVPHGGPTRQFLNQNITPHLLEGMKYIAVYEPEKPLLWLADFLRDRSKELEG